MLLYVYEIPDWKKCTKLLDCYKKEEWEQSEGLGDREEENASI